MILYFGDPRGAHALLDRGLSLVGVVLGHRDAVGLDTLAPRIARTPTWFRPNLSDPDVVAELARRAPRLLVSANYPRRIPEPVLALAPGINAHPSDLPRWRGPQPIYWALRSGDPTTAVCVHLLSPGLDEGDVLWREEMEIEPREVGGSLTRRLLQRCAELVADVAERLLAGEQLIAVPQTGMATWAPAVRGPALVVDWTRGVEEIDRFIRAASPEPGARLGPGAPPLIVLKADPHPGRGAGASPGALFLLDDQPHVRAGDGAFHIDKCRRGSQILWGPRLWRELEGRAGPSAP